MLTSQFIDTHTHIDGEEFRDDLEAVIARAKEAGAARLFVPGINAASLATMQAVCRRFPEFVLPMAGLHPEEVKEDWGRQLATIREAIDASLKAETDANCGETDANCNAADASYEETDASLKAETGASCNAAVQRYIAIGEVGLDFYWSRQYEKEQLAAFERQVEWSVETGLPLMIHCRKAQNEMVRMLRRYEGELPGGVFHCFTGNEHEAAELLAFKGFCLGIGGVLTFKKSNLPQTLASTVPLGRVVLETDAPYMAPVPHRGERNESAYISDIIEKMAEAYGVTPDEVAQSTTANARRIFPLAFNKCTQEKG